MTTIEINGRTFTVEAGTTASVPWVLRGKRGALYGTMRNIHSKRLFLFNSTVSGRVPRDLERVRLDDSDGTLRVL